MKRLRLSRGSSPGIRARVLTIVAIPVAVLLVLGVGAAVLLIVEGSAAKNWATRVQGVIPVDIRFMAEVTEERRLTLLRLGAAAPESELVAQRLLLDRAVADLTASGYELAELNPAAMAAVGTQYAEALGLLPDFRKQVDAGGVSRQDVYAYYNRLAGLIGVGLGVVAEAAPDSVTATRESTAVELMNVLESMSRANALAAGGVASGGLTEAELREYRHQVGFYRAQLERLSPKLAGHASYDKLVGNTSWQRLTTMEDALLGGGATNAPALPMSTTDWQEAARQVTGDLAALWSSYHHLAEESAIAYGDRTFRNSMLAGAGILIATIIALLIAVHLSNRLIGRLKRLRADTLRLADESLPRIVARLRDGELVDPTAEVPPLDYGGDEIGEVADAFNTAQRTAVAAAVQEARTRDGLKAVVLNIAHRSQVVVRRQLEVLDEAEGKQEDPAHLELLFQLDHLATRARRNAENLVILGGGRPGRKWRDPVPLEEIVRSAVSETADFARVGTVRLPDVAMKGTVVADVIHLLAELVDNATAFSPPASRVEVHGNPVGKGVVIEVEDQGLGIEAAHRDRLNAMLHDPPDFQVMALSGQTRLGLFVVAQLAAQHDITVTLTDSNYGGIRAIVLIPATAVASAPMAGEISEPPVRGVLPTPRHEIPPARQKVSWFEERWPEEDEPPINGEPLVHTPPPAAVDSHHVPDKDVGDTRAPLPRRRRQANLAPQLAADVEPVEVSTTDQPVQPRPPERARDTMAAVLRGTRQGRDAVPRHRRVND